MLIRRSTSCIAHIVDLANVTPRSNSAQLDALILRVSNRLSVVELVSEVPLCTRAQAEADGVGVSVMS